VHSFPDPSEGEEKVRGVSKERRKKTENVSGKIPSKGGEDSRKGGRREKRFLVAQTRQKKRLTGREETQSGTPPSARVERGKEGTR